MLPTVTRCDGKRTVTPAKHRMNLKRVFYEEVLPHLTRPGRHLGTEFNSVHKAPSSVDVRAALVFPDLYDLGLGNLGVHILYTILNDLPWCWAERAYAPPPDLEDALRARGLPLFALESKDPLSAFDLVGFSLQSELTYTSVLNILDLSNIPLRARDRSEEDPLVIGGGPAAINPEPLAPFFDVIVIGDGEEAIMRIAETVRELKDAPRAAKLRAMARIPGAYVPEHNEPGERIVRQVTDSLDDATFPVRYIVPFTQLVHDRVGLEIMRGCTHGCRFCQAGTIGRPVRTRSAEQLDKMMRALVADTGYEEVSLVSLSTCDYPGIGPLLAKAAKQAAQGDFSVSVPSLRLDTFSVQLADSISGLRRSGLTFAPEAATMRLRKVINKVFDDDQLIEVATEAFRRGWEHVKLYFMIGLPTETDEDIEALADLCLRVLSAGRAVNKHAKVFTGISTFVPKPFTPFQWAAQIPFEEVGRKHALLESRFKRNSGIKFGRHAPESTFVEGLLARGDRRTADLIEAAWRNGARLDSSSEHLNMRAWLDAAHETNFDTEAALGERATTEPLPWDHVDVLIAKEWFLREWERALAGVETDNCREAGCTRCGVIEHLPQLCATMLADAREPDADVPQHAPVTAREEPAPQQRVRVRIGRKDEARFLSHLETMTAWMRALRRAGAPMSYSQGFHAHPKITFATAPPLGEESEADYMDIVLRERVEPQELFARLQQTLPQGFFAYEADEVPLNAPSLMSAVTGFDYELRTEPGDWQARIDALLEAGPVLVERKGRPDGRRKNRDVREIDIRPMIKSLSAQDTVITFSTIVVDGKLAKPKEIIELLGLNPAKTIVRKTQTYLA
jgi:radical SAM family uncharacterized protein/radical SAM-linked protein